MSRVYIYMRVTQNEGDENAAISMYLNHLQSSLNAQREESNYKKGFRNKQLTWAQGKEFGDGKNEGSESVLLWQELGTDLILY